MKTPRQKGASAPQRASTRVNLSLDAEAYKRLFVTSVMSGRSAGDLVTELIEQHLRTWALPANLAARASQRVSAELAGPVNVSETQHAPPVAA